jgi:hypothetical protein
MSNPLSFGRKKNQLAQGRPRKHQGGVEKHQGGAKTTS